MGNSYELVEYPGHALAQANPDRLATLASLFGVPSPKLEDSRILEIGCGDGVNLVDVALGLSGAECLGIDLAALGINRGREIAVRVGEIRVDRQCLAATCHGSVELPEVFQDDPQVVVCLGVFRQ